MIASDLPIEYAHQNVRIDSFESGNFMAYLFVGIFIVSAGICHHFAKKKQLNVPFWIILGSLFGPLAIPFVVFVKSKNPSDN